MLESLVEHFVQNIPAECIVSVSGCVAIIVVLWKKLEGKTKQYEELLSDLAEIQKAYRRRWHEAEREENGSGSRGPEGD